MKVAEEKSRSATLWDLQAWTYYNLYQTTSWGSLLSDLHVPCKLWVFDRHFWCLLSLLFTGIHHLAHVLTVPPTKACLLCTTPTGLDLYIQVHSRKLLPSAVPWISEDRLFCSIFWGGRGGAQSRMRKAKQLPLKKISHKISYKQSKKKCKQQVFHSCRNNNKIMIKVPMQHKILPRETILSACMYTHTHRHLHKQAYWLYKKKAEGFLFLILYVVCFGRTMLYMCIEYHI